MSRILFNNKVIALPSKVATEAVTLAVDPLVTYATTYGLFIPTASSGYQFLRWIQKGCPPLKFDTNVSISSDLIHVTNDGEVYVVIVNSHKNLIQMYPYSSESVTYISPSRDHNEAYTYLFNKRKLNIAESIELVATGTKLGFYNPIIITVDDWVKHAKEQNLTDLFFRTKLSNF